nr:GNAT family N-acetyltransferase [Caenimonas aquaedulcis]
MLLRPFVLADHARYARFSADPEVMRYMGTGVVSTPEMAWRSMSALLGHWEMLGYGIWAIDLPGTGVIGHAGYIDVPGWPGFELGWMLGREYWGQGYAREAAATALEIAYATLKRDRVISLIRPPNAASIKLALALGAVGEGSTDLLGSPAEVYVHQP